MTHVGFFSESMSGPGICSSNMSINEFKIIADYLHEVGNFSEKLKNEIIDEFKKYSGKDDEIWRIDKLTFPLFITVSSCGKSKENNPPKSRRKRVPIRVFKDSRENPDLHFQDEVKDKNKLFQVKEDNPKKSGGKDKMFRIIADGMIYIGVNPDVSFLNGIKDKNLSFNQAMEIIRKSIPILYCDYPLDVIKEIDNIYKQMERFDIGYEKKFIYKLSDNFDINYIRIKRIA